jgi:hypothetical protein
MSDVGGAAHGLLIVTTRALSTTARYGNGRVLVAVGQALAVDDDRADDEPADELGVDQRPIPEDGPVAVAERGDAGHDWLARQQVAIAVDAGAAVATPGAVTEIAGVPVTLSRVVVGPIRHPDRARRLPRLTSADPRNAAINASLGAPAVTFPTDVPDERYPTRS